MLEYTYANSICPFSYNLSTICDMRHAVEGSISCLGQGSFIICSNGQSGISSVLLYVISVIRKCLLRYGSMFKAFQLILSVTNASRGNKLEFIVECRRR